MAKVGTPHEAFLTASKIETNGFRLDALLSRNNLTLPEGTDLVYSQAKIAASAIASERALRTLINEEIEWPEGVGTDDWSRGYQNGVENERVRLQVEAKKIGMSDV